MQYESPDDPIYRPGRPALQAANEALDLQQRHAQWHEEHPGEWDCPPELSSPTAYEDIERADDLSKLGGGGTVEPGDAFLFGKEK